jgi:hypothetical protein
MPTTAFSGHLPNADKEVKEGYKLHTFGALTLGLLLPLQQGYCLCG